MFRLLIFLVIRILSQRMNAAILYQKAGPKEPLSCLTRAVLLDVFPKKQKVTEAEKARQPLIKHSLRICPSMVSRGSVPLVKLFLCRFPCPVHGAHPCLPGNLLYTIHSLWLPVHKPICHSFIPHCGRLVQALESWIQA